MDKFYTVETESKDPCYNRFDTLEEATTEARSRAWAQARNIYVMSPVALALTPAVVNTVKVESI